MGTLVAVGGSRGASPPAWVIRKALNQTKQSTYEIIENVLVTAHDKKRGIRPASRRTVTAFVRTVNIIFRSNKQVAEKPVQHYVVCFRTPLSGGGECLLAAVRAAPAEGDNSTANNNNNDNDNTSNNHTNSNTKSNKYRRHDYHL